jgi:putative nucleotidyltransferase with HDIG domain
MFAVGSRRWLRGRGVPAFAHVLVATFVLAVLPVLLVWWLRLSGTVRSPLVSMGAGVALSLLLVNLGAAYWKRHPASHDLLFNELLLWGYIYRRLRERRLESARALLGEMNTATAQEPGAREDRARVLERLARMLDARDPLTHGHSRRVARHAWMIARRMGLGAEEVARIRTAAAIHDIGKINTPLEILRKPARLTDAEFEVIKRHPVDGAQIAAALRDKELCAIIRHHHERLDGSGYPNRLAGQEIPIGARIISVADTFDAITSVRPYQSSRSHMQALEILRSEAGDRLDPDAVRAFCSHYSGRRPLTAWATLASLPEGIFARIGGALFGGTAPAKLAALALTLGGVTAASGALPAVLPAASAQRGSAGTASAARGLAQATSSAAGRPEVDRQARFASRELKLIAGGARMASVRASAAGGSQPPAGSRAGQAPATNQSGPVAAAASAGQAAGAIGDRGSAATGGSNGAGTATSNPSSRQRLPASTNGAASWGAPRGGANGEHQSAPAAAGEEAGGEAAKSHPHAAEHSGSHSSEAHAEEAHASGHGEGTPEAGKQGGSHTATAGGANGGEAAHGEGHAGKGGSEAPAKSTPEESKRSNGSSASAQSNESSSSLSSSGAQAQKSSGVSSGEGKGRSAAEASE